MNDELSTTNEAAWMLAMKPATLRKWRMAGAGPGYVRVGLKAVCYRKKALIDYRNQ